MYVCLNGTNEKKEHIEIATEETILGMHEFMGYGEKLARKSVRYITVHVEPEPFECDYDWSNEGWEKCWAITNGYNLIRYYQEDCIAASAFSHEVMHVIQIQATGDFDHGHSTPGQWGGKEHDSAESEIRYRICQQVCPETCSHWLM